MSKWVEYTGSDEQIAEIISAKDGFIAKNMEFQSKVMKVRLGQLIFDGDDDRYIIEVHGNRLRDFLGLTNNTTHYLICNPHPLACMICLQALTGQPVFIKLHGEVGVLGFEFDIVDYENHIIRTTKPNWNIPEADYSFVPFLA